MPRLFRRRAALTVGTVKTTDLDFQFSIVRTLSREPNTAEIQIFNMSESTRSSIERNIRRNVRQQLIVEAGYDIEDGVSQIFVGDLRKAYSRKEGTDIITTVEGADGERALRRSRVNRSYAAGTTLQSVIEGVAQQIGVGIGNLRQVASGRGLENLSAVFSEGTVVSGNGGNELHGLLRSAGLEHSVQDGNLQVLPFNQPINEGVINLSPSTGLVGSPSIDNEKVMKARALIIPGLIPGRKVLIDSKFVEGFYRMEKITFTGDTSIGANEWFADIEGKAL